MRRKDKEIKDGQVIKEILEKSELCRIAVMDQEYPYIVPLYYGFKDQRLYFHSAPQGKKIELLKKNNRVCFEIEYAHEIIKGTQPCAWTSRYRSVIGYGTIEIIDDKESIKEGMEIIMAHYGSTQNLFDEKVMQRMVVLKLSIKELEGKQSGDWR
jgi:uncharacterized protein